MKLRYHLLIGALCVLSLSSCKDTVYTEDKLLNNRDNVNVVFSDAVKITANTELDTALVGNGLSVALLGSLDDLLFGKSVAGFYTNFLLPTGSVNLGTSLTIDSVKLTLWSAGKYGRYTQPMDISVYELNEGLDATQTYLNTRAFALKSGTVGHLSFQPSAADTAVTIPLSLAFGQNLINQSGTDNFANNTNFQNFFKGLYIVPNSAMPGDALYTLDLIGSLSKMTLWYHAAGDTVQSYNLILSDQCVRVNHYAKYQSGSPALFAATHPTPGGDQNIYLQGLCATRSRVNLLGLDTIKNQLVNKAELWVLPSTADSIYPFPARLYVARIDENGADQLLADYNIEANLGGFLSTETIGGVQRNVYKLNITRYAQSIMNGEFSNHGLHLYVFPSNVTGERVVVGGGNHPSLSMKLRLITTKTK